MNFPVIDPTNRVVMANRYQPSPVTYWLEDCAAWCAGAWKTGDVIRTKSRKVEVGDSMRQFLTTLGMQTNGGASSGYTTLKRQIESLAACRLTLGMYAEGRVVTKKS